MKKFTDATIDKIKKITDDSIAEDRIRAAKEAAEEAGEAGKDDGKADATAKKLEDAAAKAGEKIAGAGKAGKDGKDGKAGKDGKKGDGKDGGKGDEKKDAEAAPEGGKL